MVLNENRGKKAANLQVVKESNLTLVFNLINKNQPISRASIAHKTGLSPTTVSSLVDELISEDMVVEIGTGNLKGSGRKPIMLSVKADGGCVVGIELRQSGFELEFFDLTGKRVLFHSHEIEDYGRIGEMLVEDIKALNRNMGRLLGICVGVPGVIDRRTKKIVSTVIPIDEDNAFFDILCASFPDIRVKLGNISSFCAYIEKNEAREDIHSLVYIDINIGIGAGIILEDRIFTGAFGNAGEFGHVSVDLNGKICKCGNRGCLEAIANVPQILETVGEKSLSKIDVEDEVTREKLKPICRYMAAGINNAVNMINPEAIVLGGEITKLGKPFLKLLRSELLPIMFEANRERVILRFSSIDGNAVTRGCGRYMLDRIFQTGDFIS